MLRKIPVPLRLIPSHRSFRGLALNQTSASEEHRAEHEFQAQPSDGKKRPMSKINSDAMLDKLQNRLSGPALPMVPFILEPFKPKKDAMTLDMEPSVAENFLRKSTRCVNDATSAATSSTVALAT
jgi:hypothetical protein